MRASRWSLGFLMGASSWGCQGADGGSTGHDSADGASCAVNVVAAGPASAPTARIAIDDERAFWTFGRMLFDGAPPPTGTVKSVPLAGGTPTVVASELYVPTEIALASNDVFWLDAFSRGIMKAPKTGGATTRVLHTSNGQHLAVDGENIYWTDYENGPGVFKAPIGGGETVRLAVAEGRLTGFALDETHAYWADYVEETGVSRAARVSIDGGEPSVLHSAVTYWPSGLAVGSDAVYRHSLTGRVSTDGRTLVSILRIPLDGGAPVTLAEEPGLGRIALDATTLYFTVTLADGDAIRKIPLRGGGVSTVAVAQPDVSALAANAGNVCWLGSTVVCRVCEDPE